MKRAITVTSAALIICIFLYFALFKISDLAIKPPSPIESGDMTPISKQSSIFVPVNISSGLIAATVENTVPRSVNEKADIDIKGPVRREEVHITGNRSGLVTLLDQNGITVTGSINGISARVTGCVDLVLDCTGFSQTARGNVEFSLSAQPVFRSDWKIDPNINFKFRVPEMKTVIAKMATVSLRDKATELLNKAAGEIRAKYRNNFPLNDEFKQGAEKLWETSHQVVKIYEEPKTWAVVKPTAISVVQPKFTTENMHLGLGVDIENSIIIQETAPILETRPLPNTLHIIQEPALENVNLLLPIALDFTAFNSEISSRLQQRNLTINEDIAGKTVSIEIRDAKVSPSGNGLIIEAMVLIKQGFWGETFGGSVYFVGKPVLNKTSKQLTFSEFDYHLDSKSALAKIAAFLLKPIVLERIHQKLVVDLVALENDARTKAQMEIQRLNANMPDGVNILLDPTKIELDDLIVSKDYLHFILKVSGRVDLALNDGFVPE